MADPKSFSESAEKIPPFWLIAPQLATMHAEFLKKLQEVNQSWFERVQAEARLTSEIAAELASVRSIPEAVTIYQDWAARRMKMAAEDAERLLAESQKFVETSAHMWPGGRVSNGHGGST